MVLQSSANQLLKTLSGVRDGGRGLSLEIKKTISQYQGLEKISVVGNSLGGLYARYAIKELFDPKAGTIGGLDPHCFMTIATPHLGVRDFTYIDVPLAVKKTLSMTMLHTGRDLMLSDAPVDEPTKSLLYQMATGEEYTLPLRSFRKRILYANLEKDFAVPLGTAAFLSSQEVRRMRERYVHLHGVVAEMVSPATPHSPAGVDSGDSAVVEDMIRGLDACGWTKCIAHFDSSLPLAHQKISALRRGPEWVSDVLGFSEGKYVMNHAAHNIITD